MSTQIARELLKIAKELRGRGLDESKVKDIYNQVMKVRNCISKLKGEISKSEIRKLDSTIKYLDLVLDNLEYFF